MTRFDDRIQTHGEEVELHRDTGSVTDNYGDTTPVWGKVADEYAWIQKRKQGGNEPGMAGILDVAEYVVFLKSTTSSQDLDMVKTAESIYYRLEKVNDVTMYGGETSHKAADASKVEEG